MERELIDLLADLCVNWGFCIPSGEHYFISKKENYLAIDFARDVVKAEEMDDHSEWIDRIAERFIERFGTDEIHTSTFVDRARGTKENW